MRLSSRGQHPRIGPALAAVTILASCGDTGPTAPIEPGSVGDDRLAVVLEAIRADHDLPSLAAATILDGAVLETAAVGLRVIDRPEPVTTGDRWHLGSLTKSMTGTLAAILVEDGLVTWETAVGDVFPELVGRIRAEYVTVRLDELLHHTAGLPVDVTRAPSWNELRTAQESIIESRLRLATELLSLEPEADHGTYLYSNAGYVVAGAILERLTASSWEDLMRRRVFEPLGMTSTGFGAPGAPGQAFEPWGHLSSGGRWLPLAPGPTADNPPQLGPAGTVHATVDDYSRYAVAHLNGARGIGGLVSASTFTKLHTPAPSTNYGLGWGVTERSWAHGRVLQHAGSNTAWYAVIWLAPERNLALLAITNAGGDAAAEATDRAVVALLSRLDP